MASRADRSLWHELKGKDCASAVTATCQSLDKTQSPRRIRIARNHTLYEGRPLAGLDPAAYFTRDELIHEDFDSLRVNLARMLVNAAHAKIAGKQKPKTQFVVNDGDWSTKRKAKKIERINEGIMLARQGPSSDAWEECLKAQLFAMVGDLGAVKTTANVTDKRIDIRAVPGWQLLVDPVDAMGGQPLSLFHVYPADKFKLADESPSKFRDGIIDSADLSDEPGWASVFGRTSDVSRVCLVREAWRLQISARTKGRHAIAVGVEDLADGEEYTRDFFPFEFYVWEQWLQGIYGTSIVDSVYHLTMEANASIERMSKAERVGSNQMVFVEEGTVKKEGLESNIAKTIIEVQKGAMSPTFNTPNAISQSTVQWWQLLVGTSHDVSGVSEMSATGEKQPGVNSAVGMRQLALLGTERFSVQWQAYERRTAVGQSRQNMACLRELIAEIPGYKVRLHGGDQMEELEASHFMLDDDMYVIQPYPVSGVVNTPADRQSLGDELYSQQIIGPTARAEIYSSKDPESAISATNKWEQLISKYIESWLDATKESEQRGAEGDPKAFRYRPPIKWMPLTDVIVQVARAWADAEMDGCPDYNQQFFIRFMGDCDRYIEQMAAQQAARQQAMAPPPVVPPMGGMPPEVAAMGAPPGAPIQ